MVPWPRLLWRAFMMWRDYALVGVVGNVTSVGDCGAVVANVSGGAVVFKEGIVGTAPVGDCGVVVDFVKDGAVVAGDFNVHG